MVNGKWRVLKNRLSFQFNPHPALALRKGEGFGCLSSSIFVNLSQLSDLLVSLLSLAEGEDEGEGD